MNTQKNANAKKIGTISLKLHTSRIGMTRIQQATLDGLGLKKIGQKRTLENTPCVRGMVKKMINFVEVL